MEFQIEKADKRWFARKKLYTSPLRSLLQRVRDFYSEVVGTLLWGSDTWTLSSECVQELEIWERYKWRSIYMTMRRDEEQADEHLHRTHVFWRAFLDKRIPTVIMRLARSHIQCA